MTLRPANALATLTVLAGLAISPVLSSAAAADAPATPAAKPMRVLLVTGGCCHNYAFQSRALIDGFKAKVPSDWTVVNEGGTGTRGQIALYDDPAWAKPYSVVVHNECFADTTDATYIRKIVEGHRGGTPAVVVHCAMHTYRASAMDDWREFLGVTSMHHEHQSRYPVKIVAGDHPIMRGFPANWVTPMDELYILKKVWPGTQALATSVSEKTGESQPVVWVHDYKGTRVFGTTYGHSDDTFRDPIFIDLLTRGIVWASGSNLP